MNRTFRFSRFHSTMLGAALVLTLTVQGALAQVGQPTVATFQGDSARTGVQPGPGPQGEPNVTWRFQTGGAVRSSPALLDNTLVFGSNDGFIYAISADNGEPLWRFETDGPVRSSATIAENTVYMASSDGYVYALDLQTGELKWRFFASRPDVDGAYSVAGWYFDQLTAPVTYVDGLVLVSSNHQIFYAIDAETGIERWHGWSGSGIVTAAAIDDDLALFATDEAILAVDIETGLTVWESPFKEESSGIAFERSANDTDTSTEASPETEPDPNDPADQALNQSTGQSESVMSLSEAMSGTTGKIYIDAAPVISDNQVYVALLTCEGCDNADGGEVGIGMVISLDLADGAFTGAWPFATLGRVLSSPAVADDAIYVGSNFGFMYSVDLTTGLQRWGVNTEHFVGSSPALVGDTVYFGNKAGIVYALDTESGVERWRLALGGPIWSSPAVAGGTVYIGSDDGFLYAISGR